MDLTFRPTKFRDIDRCVSLLRGRLAYPEDVLRDLPVVWERLLREEAAISIVIEDTERPEPERIVGFGMSVFVTEAFTQEARAGTEPYLTARLIRVEAQDIRAEAENARLSKPRRSRRASSILRLDAICEANAGDGLNIVVLHYGTASEGLDEGELHQILYKAMDAFVWERRGYRVNEVLQELWDELPTNTRPGWGRILTDYADFYVGRGLPLPPPGQGPVLIGLSRDDALTNPGSFASSLFSYTLPRFAFSRGEQQLLELALLGFTDEELAEALGIARWTVKSRWGSIYERVAEREPNLLPDSKDTSETRGREKRCRVVEYVRRHPEELRPFAPGGRRRG